MSKRMAWTVLTVALAACRPSPSQEALMTPAVGSSVAPTGAPTGTLRQATFALG